MSIPKTTKEWRVIGRGSFDNLKFEEKAPISELGSSEVLVKIQGATLNYRDLGIARDEYPLPLVEKPVPGSDGAGTVVAIGKHVNRFKVGDKVIAVFTQGQIGGESTPELLHQTLGGAIDGTFRQYAAFDQQGLVAMPEGLTWTEASALTCSGLTAWNALYGLTDRQIKPGEWVLTQGTGAVSLFAVQFAKAAGARVISTTGSPSKVKQLEQLGADHILNYKENTNWGDKAKELTGGRGVDHVIEVAGGTSMDQSLNAIKMGGVISVIGYVGGDADKGPSFLRALTSCCIVRGILIGNRLQMEAMCKAVSGNLKQLRPIIDSNTFRLEKLKEAYEYQWSAKHVGNVGIIIE